MQLPPIDTRRHGNHGTNTLTPHTTTTAHSVQNDSKQSGYDAPTSRNPHGNDVRSPTESKVVTTVELANLRNSPAAHVHNNPAADPLGRFINSQDDQSQYQPSPQHHHQQLHHHDQQQQQQPGEQFDHDERDHKLFGGIFVRQNRKKPAVSAIAIFILGFFSFPVWYV